jgi:hypothetical protein
MSKSHRMTEMRTLARCHAGVQTQSTMTSTQLATQDKRHGLVELSPDAFLHLEVKRKYTRKKITLARTSFDKE